MIGNHKGSFLSSVKSVMSGWVKMKPSLKELKKISKAGISSLLNVQIVRLLKKVTVWVNKFHR